MSGALYRTLLQWALVFPFFSLAGVVVALAAAPAIYTFTKVIKRLSDLQPWLYYPSVGFLLGFCYFLFGVGLIFVAPFFNFILGGRLKPFRGSAVSLKCLPFYIHATMTMIVRLSFLEFVTPTPFNLLFYRLMGMKIGEDVTINSTAICEPSMIVMEDKVTIGGTASILAHYGQSGYLIIAPVVLRKGVTIGMRAIVMGGVEIGEKAKVLAGSFVLPNTKIPAGETWAGIPAARIELSKDKENEE